MRTVAIPDYHSTPGNKGAYALQQLAMHVIVARCSRAHIPGEGRDALLCQLKSRALAAVKRPKHRMCLLAGAAVPISLDLRSPSQIHDTEGTDQFVVPLILRRRVYRFLLAALKISTKRSAMIFSSPSFSCHTAKPKVFGSLGWRLRP